MIDELKYFQKKYSYEIKIISEENYIIPEYKIDLLNKSKKIISTIENVNKILQSKPKKDALNKEKKEKTKLASKDKFKTKKIKIKKKVRTLWVRKKRKIK